MKTIRINPLDNVAVALEDLPSGVKRGHKYALCDLPPGADVVKYGMPIGTAKCTIRQGEWVHTHNLQTKLDGVLEYTYAPRPAAAPAKPETPAFFDGFLRSDGRVGVRNHLFVVPTVGCVNKLAATLAARINRELPQGTVDRAIALEHPYGCSQLGDDHETTRAILAGLVRHPNAGGVLVVGLGCENNTIDAFRERLGQFDETRIRFMTAQRESDEVGRGLEILRELAALAGHDRRTRRPASELVIGLKCGGSDGLSGITANPLLGRFSDWLTAQGGSTILGEVPEMFGAETLLMARCRDRAVFDRCVAMVNDFKQYFTRHHQTIYENPSPGNKAGGISTLEDKSLGCTQKAGSATVNGVLAMGEPLTVKGLNLLSGPGNDMVASTLPAAAGAHIILFTTGRGTPFGTVVPTLKIASNSELAAFKPNWCDFDAGRVLQGESLDGEFRDLVLAVASGQPAQNERNGYEEIAIFKDGVTL